MNHPSPIQKTSSSTAPRPDVERLCAHLADRIEDNGSKRPAVTDRWRASARLLIDADHRTEPQVHAAIDWCQDHNFWRANILSMHKLREKYDQLRLAATRNAASGESTADQRVAAGLNLAAELRREEAASSRELTA